MTFLVPDRGRFDDVASQLSPTVLDSLSGARSIQVNLALPKFDIQKSLDVSRQLS